tara:strand:- start:1296 stop:1496 length:201 start_codon:yes stop_codon:yes gene_type:complete
LKKKITFLCFIIVFYPLPSYSYLDPGTGSIILQALIASIAAIGVFFSQLKMKFLEFKIKLFKKKKK